MNQVREVGNMTGNGECLFNNGRDDDEYDNDNKTTMRRMGRGRVGERTMGGIRLRRPQCHQRAVRRGRGAEDVDRRGQYGEKGLGSD